MSSFKHEVSKAAKVSLVWFSARDPKLCAYRFLGRLRDLESETPRALKFGGIWYPRSQMANADGLDGMEFWVKRWVTGVKDDADANPKPADRT